MVYKIVFFLLDATLKNYLVHDGYHISWDSTETALSQPISFADKSDKWCEFSPEIRYPNLISYEELGYVG